MAHIRHDSDDQPLPAVQVEQPANLVIEAVLVVVR